MARQCALCIARMLQIPIQNGGYPGSAASELSSALPDVTSAASKVSSDASNVSSGASKVNSDALKHRSYTSELLYEAS